MFLAGKNVYRTIDFKRGDKKLRHLRRARIVYLSLILLRSESRWNVVYGDVSVKK